MRYLHKGSRVRIVGSLRTHSWSDRETGLHRHRTFVRADEVLFLDSRPGPTIPIRMSLKPQTSRRTCRSKTLPGETDRERADDGDPVACPAPH